MGGGLDAGSDDGQSVEVEVDLHGLLEVETAGHHGVQSVEERGGFAPAQQDFAAAAKAEREAELAVEVELAQFVLFEGLTVADFAEQTQGFLHDAGGDGAVAS